MSKEDDALIGFSREEMFTVSLAGEHAPPLVHVFVVYGEALDWQNRLEEVENSPIQVFQRELKDLVKENPELKKKVTITAVPASSKHDQVGDVLVFPQRVTIENGTTLAKAILQEATRGEGGNLLSLPGAKPMSPIGHVFVCCHEQRDARCGFCGPKIIQAVEREAELSEKQVAVRACSHIGGHRYAGNAIVFRGDNAATCDWLGYLTDSAEDAEYIVGLATGDIQIPDAKTWRGRRGLSRDEHKSLCAACGDNKDMEDLGQKEKPKVVFVLAAPGIETTASCQSISNEFGLVYLNTNALLGKEASPLGAAPPVELAVQRLFDVVEKSPETKFMIDGFLWSNEHLDGWKRVVKNNAKVLGCVVFDGDENMQQERLLAAGMSPESIRSSISAFEEASRSLVKLYSKRGKCFSVPGAASQDKVLPLLRSILNEKLGLEPPSSREDTTDSSPKPNVLFVLGGPGAGKGTQCDKITEAFEFQHLSAGDLLRAERMNPASTNGQLIEKYIKDGLIVPVEITVELLLEAMKKSKTQNFLIDGFPRNFDNLSGWERVVGQQAKVLGCLYFDCPESVMEKRLLERGKTSGRSDDNIESIRKRFHTYINDTMPIIHKFERQGNCFKVSSDRGVDAIFNDVHRVLSKELGFTPRVPLAKPEKTLSIMERVKKMPTLQKVAIGTAGAAVLMIGYRLFKKN